ncbi:unnamed protein product [Rhizoctonia solani]|uniref:Uncharacterized protein n=1 Tax=Rhizoctonia solani TaxID=456999 RepID=A0A8H3DGB6_9AGAM|nr:unnamed protein product [Rhizoctonia solani]
MAANKKKVLLMGKSGSGKTSMRSVIFSNNTASATSRLGATIDVEQNHMRFLGDLMLNLWDCGGQDNFFDSYLSSQRQTIFNDVAVLIYVFDIEIETRQPTDAVLKEKEKDFEYFYHILDNCRSRSPEAKIFVLINKMDLISGGKREKDEAYSRKVRELETRAKPIMGEKSLRCFGTSIWDQSLYRAWSRIVHTLIPNANLLARHLSMFCSICDATEVVLFERTTFLIIARSGRNGEFGEQGDEVSDSGDDPINPERFEKISELIKAFKLSCSFGFHGTNNIDNLLNQEEVSLEAILDHDDLLSECKQQNPRLIDYLQHPEVLKRLFAYVTGEIVSEGRGSFKYPYVSTEVLCCEIWSVVERCTENSAEILAPFWDTVLSMPPEELRTKASVAAHFSKISGTFLMKKPEEMLAFIKSIPDVVNRMLAHIESPPFVDLLFRIIQLDENPGNIGVMEWLSSQDFIPNLVDRLSPRYPTSVHLVVADLLKGIISVASPSPGSFNLNGPHDSGPTGPVTNRFVRELASTNIVETMVGFMLDDAPFGPPVDEVLREAEEKRKKAPQEVTLTVPSGLGGPPGVGLRARSPMPPSDSSSTHVESPQLPNAESATSSVTHIVSIFVELIRKNNSDYFEPYLFHTLRNRLMQIQQQLLDEMHEMGADMDTSQRAQEERERERLERAMADMVDHLGIVHLGRFLRILAKRIPDFQELLRRPRSLNGYVPTSVGQLIPLTLERFRIIELYAELLHCSNMSLLNRRRGFGPSYDDQGRLMGGLDALEQLARVIDPNVSSDAMMDQSLDSDTVQDLKELPVSSASTDCSSLTSEDGVSVDDEHAELEEDLASSRGSTKSASAQPSSSSVMPPSGPSADTAQESSTEADPFSDPESGVGSSDMSTPKTDVSSSNTSTVRHSPVAEHYGVVIDRSAFEPSGDILKQKMIDLNIVSTILDFFFEFPWNNFLHNAVYDMLHQILTGRVDNELSRRVTIGMFRDARLVYRILEGSRRNDAVAAQQKGLRLGYMGHLILISDDIVAALEHYPHSLLEALSPYVPQPDWNDFVAGQYKETKERDTSQLGGGKPAVSAMGIGIGRGGPVGGLGTNRFGDTPSPRMESAVGRGIGPVPQVIGGADFGPAEPDDTLTPSDPVSVTTEQAKSNQANSDPLSDEDDANDPAWDSSHSASGDFDLNAAHTSNRGTQDPFESPSDSITSVSQFSTIFRDEDEDDDVNWGPFADPAGQKSALQPSFDDEEDGFGDFQNPMIISTSSFDDSFDGFNAVASPNLSGQIQEAVDDTMDEPTTPKASERRLSSSFETIDKPDQDDSWNWPTPETPAAAGGDRNNMATSDAVADAMTSPIVPR